MSHTVHAYHPVCERAQQVRARVVLRRKRETISQRRAPEHRRDTPVAEAADVLSAQDRPSTVDGLACGDGQREARVPEQQLHDAHHLTDLRDERAAAGAAGSVRISLDVAQAGRVDGSPGRRLETSP